MVLVYINLKKTNSFNAREHNKYKHRLKFAKTYSESSITRQFKGSVFILLAASMNLQ